MDTLTDLLAKHDLLNHSELFNMEGVFQIKKMCTETIRNCIPFLILNRLQPHLQSGMYSHHIF